MSARELKPKGTISAPNLPLVSLVVPSFDGLELLKLSLPSLTCTDYPSFEVIVVDNGSSDGTSSYLFMNYPGIRIAQMGGNVGFAAACNAGMAIARGKYVSFLNNDMEFEPSWLRELVDVMEKDETVVGCDPKYLNYFDRNIIDGSGGAGRFMDRYGNAKVNGGGRSDSPEYDNSREVFYCLALFRREVLAAVGGFDEAFFAYFEDVDLCWRLRKLGGRIMFVPKSKIYHMGGTTTSRKVGEFAELKPFFTFHFYKNRLRMLLKNCGPILLPRDLFVYSLDFFGASMFWVITRRSQHLLAGMNAILWNLKHLRESVGLRHPSLWSNESIDNVFCSYNGEWRKYVVWLQRRMSRREKSERTTEQDRIPERNRQNQQILAQKYGRVK